MTLRTIRYYDRIGLLKPAAYSESGQRLYTELDYARLQQILTLKLIGLSLEEIKNLLTTDRAEIEQMLERQERVLSEQAERLKAVIQTIEQARRAMQAAQTLDLEHFIEIIKAVNMNTQADWLDQFYDREQQAKLAAMNDARTLDDHRAIGQAWKALFADIQAYLESDVTAPEVQALVKRWDALIGQFTGGDIELAANLNRAYEQIAALFAAGAGSAEVEQWTASLQQAAQFIQRAREARS
ncbi:MAG: MerR family transcriptional regulator [Anaerolineae bacterium]|nr:MerR family transcriptional regulator [Anaerolineae bacterium]